MIFFFTKEMANVLFKNYRSKYAKKIEYLLSKFLCILSRDEAGLKQGCYEKKIALWATHSADSKY